MNRNVINRLKRIELYIICIWVLTLVGLLNGCAGLRLEQSGRRHGLNLLTGEEFFQDVRGHALLCLCDEYNDGHPIEHHR